MQVEFESDPDKAKNNLRTHNVSFSEAATVFGDFLSMTIAEKIAVPSGRSGVCSDSGTGCSVSDNRFYAE